MKEVHTAQIENAEVICTKCGNPGSTMSDAELDALLEALFSNRSEGENQSNGSSGEECGKRPG